MHRLIPMGAILFLSAFCLSGIARAQSPIEDVGPLPVALTTEQLQTLAQLNAAVPPSAPKPQARRRLPIPGPILGPQQMTYKLAIEKLGADPHRFVHCDLSNGKVRTGVITEIHDYGFVLKDGILFDRWIPYKDLTAAPRPVTAVGTRIGQGFKWAGLVLVTVPLLPFAFLFWDGC